MAWFNKKENTPDVPRAPRLPDLPPMIGDHRLPELPSFPEIQENDNLDNEIVKSAVDDSSVDLKEALRVPGSENLPDFREKDVKMEELPRDFRLQNPPTIQKMQKSAELPVAPSPVKVESPKINEPIFVKIDKFQSAQSDFTEIKKKVKEFDLTLKKVKELKTKEDQELSMWTEDLEKIKARLSEIDSSIFSKI